MTIDLSPEQRGITEKGEQLNVHPEMQYLDLMRRLIEGGYEQTDRKTHRKTYSSFGEKFVFDLDDGFPLLTTKKLFWKGIKHELHWFLSGQTNIKYLIDNGVHIWDDYPYAIYMDEVKAGNQSTMTKEEFVGRIKDDGDFASMHGELPHIYGESWRRLPRNGKIIDQVSWVLNEIKKDPDAHNLVVDSWRPEHHHGMTHPKDAMRFPICHNQYQLNVQNGKLNLQLYQRTADIFLGVPFNIASYALLTHELAHLLGLKPGRFTHVFGDVHIYENHFEQAEEQLSREPRPFPRVTIHPDATSLDDIGPQHVILEGYDPHPVIKADLTPAGGYFEEE